MKKVIVGLSGGVDSSVVAALLLEQGYKVDAVYLECYNTPGCRTDQDKQDALRVAMHLGIRFQTLDFREEYKQKVSEYFYREYEAGRTPNPDVMCNREIKFGIFYNWAMEQGYDFVATGHYARILDKNGSLHLQMAKDESKDQSYFLWQIPSDHLRHILFPLGEMDKSVVRAKAKELELVTADKPDSMGICFVGEVNVNQLLRTELGENRGEVIIQSTGLCIGEHRGLWFYTIGQRGGWEMDPKKQSSDMSPLYVIGKDKKLNRLLVGKREECYTNRFKICDFGLMNFSDKKIWVRVRNLGELYEVEGMSEEVVRTKKSIFAVADGQSAVFYDDEKMIVGGGIIEGLQ